MRKIFLNNELSMELNETGKYIIGSCYDNVFDNISQVSTMFKERDLKVMFCYMSVGKYKNIYTRHACFYLDGEAVDPTIAKLHGDSLPYQEVTYIPFKLLSVDEYFDLASHELRTDINRSLIEAEGMTRKELGENGLIIIG